MKRAFTLLFLAVVLIYGKTWLSVHSFASSLQGVLSDVAEEVRAIPLENAGGNAINNAVQVKQEGSNLFLISDHVLYRYNNNGRFICRITHPAVMEARMYVVDPLRKELIVFGNDHDVHYYDYQGNLLDSKELDRGEEGFRRIYSMNWHNDRLFSIEENTYINPDTQQIDIQKEVVTYDRSMQKIDARPLCAVDLGRPRNNMYDLIDSQLCLDPDTGRLIVYNPASIPDYLPEDTLYLRRNWETQLAVASANNSVPVVPIRPAGRFWCSSLAFACDEGEECGNYTYCFDNSTFANKTVKRGLLDDFHKTGEICLAPMDLSHHTFCFSHKKDHGNAVVFIVTMKG